MRVNNDWNNNKAAGGPPYVLLDPLVYSQRETRHVYALMDIIGIKLSSGNEEAKLVQYEKVKWRYRIYKRLPFKHREPRETAMPNVE